MDEDVQLSRTWTIQRRSSGEMLRIVATAAYVQDDGSLTFLDEYGNLIAALHTTQWLALNPSAFEIIQRDLADW